MILRLKIPSITSPRRWLRRRKAIRLGRMSLRNRLRVSIVSLVTLMVAVQFLASIRVTADADFSTALERSKSFGVQVRSLLLDRLTQEINRADPPPATLDESIAIWTGLLEHDTSIAGLLERLTASSSVAVETQVCDQAGKILTSSSASRPRVTFRSVPDFEEWNIRTLWDRLFEVLTQRKEYSIVVPLGVPQLERPIFTIRVLVSSVLLRNTLIPRMKNLAATSALSLLAAILLAVLFSNMVLRALNRLSKRIELMTAGDFAGATSSPSHESEEIAAVSSKLNLLGEQFRDAMRLRGNIDHMLRSIEAAVMMFDPDHRLVLAGQAAERILGRNRESLIGRTIEEIFPLDTALGSAIRQATVTGTAFRDRPAILERPEGAPIRLTVSLEMLENLPGVHHLGTLVTLRDVESQRKLQSQFNVNARLTAINRLTGGVAHEIKNPLNAIALHLEILKAKLEENPAVETELKVIEREISRLDRVVKTFLDFTRPVELELATVDLNELLGEVQTLVLPEAQIAGVTINFQPSTDDVFIEAGRDLLKQAILNIVMNGIEAMPDGGYLEMELLRGDESVELAISDEGTGIPPEVREKIFNLYFTTKDGGSGIGLAMTFRVISLHNATIDFSSDIGKGTTFRLRFPVSDDTPRDAPAPQLPRQALMNEPG